MGEAMAITAPTTSGPAIQMTSWMTDSSAYAVSRTSGSGRRSRSSARTAGAIGGIREPAIAERAMSAAAPAPPWAAMSSAHSARHWATATGGSTRRRPNRSTSRPSTGAPPAVAKSYAPTATPAAA